MVVIRSIRTRNIFFLFVSAVKRSARSEGVLSVCLEIADSTELGAKNRSTLIYFIHTLWLSTALMFFVFKNGSLQARKQGTYTAGSTQLLTLRSEVLLLF